jgi:autotransporter adhesin
MAYDQIKESIKAVIKENGNYEITGNVLQAVLLSMVDTLGPEYQFLGIATKSTVPVVVEGNSFYITTEVGTYTNFKNSGNTTITVNKLGILTSTNGTAWNFTPIFIGVSKGGGEVFNDYDNNTAAGNNSHAEGAKTNASGDNSHAEGSGGTATGTNSHVEGLETNTEGANSHAEGYQSGAFGDDSHAEGRLTKARGVSSHAEGHETEAVGVNSHTEGYQTHANKDNSHAEGRITVADGKASHAEGDETQASGDYSHAEGQKTVASGLNSHTEGYNTKATKSNSHAEGYQSGALGLMSHAEGQLTSASGISSHAEGLRTNASKDNSHAEGQHTTAAGIGAHAEGADTQALGDASHAEGQLTNATASNSHAEGNSTVASGVNSHTEGYNTKATKSNSHAEGNSTGSNGLSSHTEGTNTLAEGDNSHAEGNGGTATGTNSHVEGLETNTEGANSHAEGYQSGAFGDDSHAEGQLTNARGVSSHAEGHETEAVGANSHAEGFQTHANKDDSHAEGRITVADGKASHAEGDETQASGDYSHAEGQKTVASGLNSHTEGYNTKATKSNSHAEGYQSGALGLMSHAEGQLTSASGISSHTEGFQTYANKDNSHAEGRITVADGKASHAEGDETQASGDYSHAEGQKTVASGVNSHAEGQLTNASGISSHAEGLKTEAVGSNSHAEGLRTNASKDNSHAEGLHTTAAGIGAHAEGQDTTAGAANSHAEGQGTVTEEVGGHVAGMYNAVVANGLFNFGIGSSDDKRKSAMIIDGTNGKVYFVDAGGYDGGTSITNAKSIQDILKDSGGVEIEQLDESFDFNKNAQFDVFNNIEDGLHIYVGTYRAQNTQIARMLRITQYTEAGETKVQYFEYQEEVGATSCSFINASVIRTESEGSWSWAQRAHELRMYMQAIPTNNDALSDSDKVILNRLIALVLYNDAITSFFYFNNSSELVPMTVARTDLQQQQVLEFTGIATGRKVISLKATRTNVGGSINYSNWSVTTVFLDQMNEIATQADNLAKNIYVLNNLLTQSDAFGTKTISTASQIESMIGGSYIDVIQKPIRDNRKIFVSVLSNNDRKDLIVWNLKTVGNFQGGNNDNGELVFSTMYTNTETYSVIRRYIKLVITNSKFTIMTVTTDAPMQNIYKPLLNVGLDTFRAKSGSTMTLAEIKSAGITAQNVLDFRDGVKTMIRDSDEYDKNTLFLSGMYYENNSTWSLSFESRIIDEFATVAGIKRGSFLSINSIGEGTFKIEYRKV